jgi:hypothetical protein
MEMDTYIDWAWTLDMNRDIDKDTDTLTWTQGMDMNTGSRRPMVVCSLKLFTYSDSYRNIGSLILLERLF